MIKIKRETIIKPGDVLSEASGKTWTVQKIEGYYFFLKDNESGKTGVISKWDLVTEDWSLEIKDKRGYF